MSYSIFQNHKMPISIPSSIKGISAQGISKGPLELLYGVKTDKDILSYPRDLNTNPAKQHVIQFTIMKPDGAPVTGITLGTAQERFKNIFSPVYDIVKQKGVAAAAETGLATGKNAMIGAIEDLKGALTQEKGLEYAANLGADALIGANNLIRNELTTRGVNRIAGPRINLYIPDGLNVGYASSYTESSVTEMLGRPYFFAQLAASVADKIKSEGGLKNISTTDITGNPYLRQLAAQKLGGLTGTSLTQAALAASGFAVNPQLQVLFTGIGFRQFRFEFTLTPYSQEEAETIKKIVSFFKFASAPTIEKTSYFDSGLFYRVPDPVRLSFLFGGKENTNIPKIEECVIRNVNVEYSPMGWATFADGNPVQTKLTLELDETVLIDKNKIKEGY